MYAQEQHTRKRKKRAQAHIATTKASAAYLFLALCFSEHRDCLLHVFDLERGRCAHHPAKHTAALVQHLDTVRREQELLVRRPHAREPILVAIHKLVRTKDEVVLLRRFAAALLHQQPFLYEDAVPFGQPCVWCDATADIQHVICPLLLVQLVVQLHLDFKELAKQIVGIQVRSRGIQ